MTSATRWRGGTIADSVAHLGQAVNDGTVRARASCCGRTGTKVMGAMALGCRVLGRSGRSEPGGKCSRQLWVREVSCPGDVPVGTDQHGPRRCDLADERQLP